MKTQKIEVLDPIDDPVAGLMREVEEYLAVQLAGSATAPSTLRDAMEHATLAGGKRVRPILCLMVNAAAGGKDRAFAMAAGAAVEYVHCASLILDDLPCMDDAALRRGQPAAHKLHGEATTILAAIGLMNLAYEQIARAPIADDRVRARAMRVLTEAVGTAGLVTGQELDLREKAEVDSLDALDEINWLKTGVLFVAAAELGAIAAGASEAQVAHVRDFAKHLGMAFQTRDDILDQVASSDETGKDAHQDDASTTLIRLAGFAAASGDCRAHLAEASAALDRSGIEIAGLTELIGQVFRQLSAQPS